MGKHVNVVVHLGELVDGPMMIPQRNGSKLLSFTLRIDEEFQLRDGTPGLKENFFKYEVLGKHVDEYLQTLVRGRLYKINGYLREDMINGVKQVRVRCYKIESAE